MDTVCLNSKIQGIRTLHPTKLPAQVTAGCYTTEAARIGFCRMLHHRSCQNGVQQDATPQKLPE